MRDNNNEKVKNNIDLHETATFVKYNPFCKKIQFILSSSFMDSFMLLKKILINNQITIGPLIRERKTNRQTDKQECRGWEEY